MSEGVYQLCLPDQSMLSVRVNALGEYEVARHTNGIKKPIGMAKDLPGALKLADKAVPLEATIVLRSDASWRHLPPTEPQLGLLKRLYPELRAPCASDTEFYRTAMTTYSRGQVSQLLSARDRRAGR